MNTLPTHWFFDLDGTLARTGEDIVIAWKGALTALGRDLTRFDDVFRIGPPLEKIVYDLYDDATPELVADLLRRFKPLYDESGFPNTVPYEGVPEMLTALRQAGAKIYIVTNKRHDPTQGIVRKLGWNRIFDGVWSYDSFDVKYKKPDLLRRLLGDLGVSACPPSEASCEAGAMRGANAVMVGDTKGDVDAGAANGMMTIGVTWGYGSREELSAADRIVDSPSKILQPFNPPTL